MLRLAYFVSHPIQYQAPLLRQIARDNDIDLEVFFYSDFSLNEYQDIEFGQKLKWDIPLVEGYNHSFLDCWGSKRRYSFLKQPVARNIFEQIKTGKFDAVWVHGWGWLCSIQAILAANQLGIPVLFRGESNGMRESTAIKLTAKRLFINWLFSKIDAFLYVGTLNRKFYESYGINRDRLFFCPYTVDNDFFRQQAADANKHREKFRKSLGLEPGRPIILYAAKLIEKKRPQDLLAAYRMLSPDGIQEPEPYLLFVGDGALREGLEVQAQAIGWQSIRFLGFQNQSKLPPLYDLCDVFVLPSSYEPWGLVVNEVMNAGRAVIVSDQVGCADDLVLDGKNGKIFPAGNIPALANSIRWAVDCGELAGRHSLNLIQSCSFQENITGIKSAWAKLSCSY